MSLLPSVRATWAPRGQPPVLRHHFAWKRLSIAGVLAYEPDGSDAHLVFQLRPGAYKIRACDNPSDATSVVTIESVDQSQVVLGLMAVGAGRVLS